jgi:RNA polymerase sigma-70 factor (ECF subfamily)
LAALGQLLEGFRPYLTLLARRRFDPRMQSRIDPSDLVQLTFLEAQRDWAAFRGSSVGELASWLRTALQRNAQRAAERHLDAQRRSVDREENLPASPSGPAVAPLIDEQSSPSQRVMRGEAAVLLAAALLELPDDQQEAVRLRHLEGWTLPELAAHFQRSEVAVAGLIKRGLRRLRQLLG